MRACPLPIASEALETLRTGSDSDRQMPRLLGIFAAWRLRAYAYGIAIVYVVAFVDMYWTGGWIVNSTGAPIYTDFTTFWVAGLQALHGDTAALFDTTEFLNIQTALLGPHDFFYPNWGYPPTFSLIMAPFALLPYVSAFLAWDFLTLLGCVVVVYLIVRRSPAVALVLASPFTAWNFLAGQNGFLTASLLGAALLSLERQPALAGVFIGCLTYKPQFCILLPLALAASREWRALASAAATALLLAGGSIAALGVSAWEAFPRGILELSTVLQAGGSPGVEGNWGYFQSIYGLIRYLHGGAVLAWVGQVIVTLCVAVIVWLVWRSPARYALKAAILSAATLLATRAFAYDLAAIAVPVAFLARDQMRCGLLRGEQTILLGTFVAVLALLVALGDPRVGVTFGSVPIGPALTLTILGLVLRRVISSGAGIDLLPPKPAAFMAANWRPLKIL